MAGVHVSFAPGAQIPYAADGPVAVRCGGVEKLESQAARLHTNPNQ